MLFRVGLHQGDGLEERLSPTFERRNTFKEFSDILDTLRHDDSLSRDFNLSPVSAAVDRMRTIHTLAGMEREERRAHDSGEVDALPNLVKNLEELAGEDNDCSYCGKSVQFPLLQEILRIMKHQAEANSSLRAEVQMLKKELALQKLKVADTSLASHKFSPNVSLQEPALVKLKLDEIVERKHVTSSNFLDRAATNDQKQGKPGRIPSKMHAMDSRTPPEIRGFRSSASGVPSTTAPAVQVSPTTNASLPTSASSPPLAMAMTEEVASPALSSGSASSRARRLHEHTASQPVYQSPQNMSVDTYNGQIQIITTPKTASPRGRRLSSQ